MGRPGGISIRDWNKYTAVEGIAHASVDAIPACGHKLGTPSFQAKVLTTPIPLTPRQISAIIPGTPESGNDKVLVHTTFKGRIEELHWSIADPCDIAFAKVTDLRKVRKLISKHTSFIASTSAAERPAVGDIVEVKLKLDSTCQWNLQFGTYVAPVQHATATSSPQRKTCWSPMAVFKRNGNNAVWGNNRINDVLLTSPNVAEGKMIKGEELADLSAVVEEELTFWKGKKETDLGAYPSLEKYWNNVGETRSDRIRTAHWSAVFISYVVDQVDSAFEGSAAHAEYVENAKNGKGGWTQWAIKGDIVAQVGDILVYPRWDRESQTWGGHGDVVYKISGTSAYLAGGNLGGSAIGNIMVSVTSDGFYNITGDGITNSSNGTYFVILKKRGQQLPSTRS